MSNPFGVEHVSKSAPDHHNEAARGLAGAGLASAAVGSTGLRPRLYMAPVTSRTAARAGVAGTALLGASLAVEAHGSRKAKKKSRKLAKSAFGVEHVSKGITSATAGAGVTATRGKKVLVGQNAPSAAPAPSSLAKVTAKLKPIAAPSSLVS